jgi:hypothetical protein
MRYLYLAALVAASLPACLPASPAGAQTYIERCSWQHGSRSCIYTASPGAGALVVRVPQYGVADTDEYTEQERLARRQRSCASPSVVCLEAGR